MGELARAPEPFGARPRHRNSQGEDELQAAMGAALFQRGLSCDRELPFSSSRFINKRRLELDIAVGDFGIELKHVACQPGGGPSDAQGFPYDVILDCARLEVLIGDGLKDERHELSVRDGVAVGLTNDERMWDPDVEPEWWSKNFRLPDVAGGGWTPLPRRFFEVVRTTGRRDADGAVYVDERYHVRLADRWEYRWKDLPASWQGCKPFRYLVVRRRGRGSAGAIRPGVEPMTVVPFASPQGKVEAVRHRLDVVRRLHADRLAAPAGSRRRRGAASTGRLIGALEADLRAPADSDAAQPWRAGGLALVSGAE